MQSLAEIIDEVLEELKRADAKHGRMKGKVRGLGTLKNEVSELSTEVHGEDFDFDAMKAEAVQVAAMGLKFLRDCCQEQKHLNFENFSLYTPFDREDLAHIGLTAKNEAPKFQGILSRVKRKVNTPEPPPVKNDHPDTVDLVVDDLLERAEIGKLKYGGKLQPFNGRRNLIDLYQEIMDALLYLRNEIYEQDAKRD